MANVFLQGWETLKLCKRTCWFYITQWPHQGDTRNSYQALGWKTIVRSISHSILLTMCIHIWHQDNAIYAHGKIGYLLVRDRDENKIRVYKGFGLIISRLLKVLAMATSRADNSGLLMQFIHKSWAGEKEETTIVGEEDLHSDLSTDPYGGCSPLTNHLLQANNFLFLFLHHP